MYRWLVYSVAVFCVAVIASTAPSTAAASPCKTIDGATPFLDGHALILVGEMHGTEQIPAFVGDLVCAALDRGLQVNLGLEIPQSEASRLTDFLASDGGTAAQLALIGSEFWLSEEQDGRSSIAMLELIDRVRLLHRAGRKVTLLPIDVPFADAGAQRDERIAQQVRKAAMPTRGVITIVLTGNLHSRLSADPDYPQFGRPMGSYLTDLKPASLAPAYTEGTAWACMPTCGVQALKSTPQSLAPWHIEARRTAFTTHLFGVGTLSASPPANRNLTAKD